MMFVVLLASLLSVSYAADCKFNGFDFSKEFGGVTFDHMDDFGYSIYFSPCELVDCPPATDPTFPPSDPLTDATAILYSYDWCASVIANLATGKWSYANGNNHDNGILLEYSGGGACFDAINQHSMAVTFVCDPVAPAIKTSTDFNACHWDVQIASETVCGGGGGLSGGWVFTIIVLTSIAVYFIGGCIFMWRFKGTQIGPESMPNMDFWRALPGLVKDGSVFTWEKVRGDKYKTLDDEGTSF